MKQVREVVEQLSGEEKSREMQQWVKRPWGTAYTKCSGTVKTPTAGIDVRDGE